MVSRSQLMVVALILAIARVSTADDPAIDPDEGVKHIAWTDAAKAVGETAYVSGKIVSTGKAGDRIAFLNFDRERPPGFVAVIFSEHWDKFPGDPTELYKDKIVEIRGTIGLHKGKPQIVVTRPDQIKVLEALPPTEELEDKSVTTWSDDPDRIVISIFNVENLFDDADDPYRHDEGTPAKSRDGLEKVAAAIRKVNADVVALQEVESRGFLERFVTVFLPDMGYSHIVHFEGNDQRGIDVALLSRAPIGEVASRRHLEFAGPDGVTRRFQRDVPAITVMPNDALPFEIWPVHFKSKSGDADASEPVRLAEAAEVRRLLDAEFAADPEARIIVAGDFNDTRESKSMAIVFGSGATEMWAPDPRETSDSRVDPEFPDGRAPIDFITFSPAMRKRYIADSAEVRRAPPSQDGSDHDPQWATFQLN
jgi:endonuclease/exonuclease/phosphatase family metal-dependent hydrolase